MTYPIRMQQTPQSGAHRLMFRGDTFTFTLETDPAIGAEAKVFLHTNIGFAQIRREEIIHYVEDGTPVISEDWHDIPMEQVAPGRFSVMLALNQIGYFEGKCCMLLKQSEEMIWVEGEPVHLNVEPDKYSAGNSVYCAFIRQFGPNKTLAVSEQSRTRECVTDLLDRQGYTVIPPSGTFRDLIKELDLIINRLRCQIIQLLPINPVPTVYGRMGRFGSPYAALDFTAVDPAYAEFDRKATPLDQFVELIDAVHHRNAKLFLDIAINHTGWAAVIHQIHPEWLVRNPDGTIHSPGAWGTVWEDLTELNHNKLELWQYLADMFMVWCARGVDGFRCDAGYMIPFDAWRYIIARVRTAYPETIFLLEGLGGDPMITLKLLDQANMNWAYSELFQNFSRQAIEGYLNYANRVSTEDGLLIHYAETHDNMRLAASGEKWARMRTALSALTSANGAFAFTNGVEWFATEKVDVHKASALNWNSKVNQVEWIARLNLILQNLSPFHPGARMRFIDSGSNDVVMLYRSDEMNTAHLLVVVNINCQAPALAVFNPTNAPMSADAETGVAPRETDSPVFYDLLSGGTIQPVSAQGNMLHLALKPGEVLCLSASSRPLKLLEEVEKAEYSVEPNFSNRTQFQTLCAVVLDLYCWKYHTNALPENFDVKSEARKLYENLPDYLTGLFAEDEMLGVIYWDWPQDQYRKVMIPPGHLLVVRAKSPFRAALLSEDCTPLRQYDAIACATGDYVTVFTPLKVPSVNTDMALRIFLHSDNRSRRVDAPLYLLTEPKEGCRLYLDNAQLRTTKRTALLTNGKGGMIRPSVYWGEVHDRYHALLAANLNPNFPEDRHVMFTRLRIKVIHNARTEELRLDLTQCFYLNQAYEPVWLFSVPVGSGRKIPLWIRMSAVPGKNCMRIHIRRACHNACGKEPVVGDSVRLRLYPDVEDRNFHQETKAYAGPERNWPHAIRVQDEGHRFIFAPAADRILNLSVDKGNFICDSRWFYNLWHETEASRGLEANSDLWSPGYFEVRMEPGEEMMLRADVVTSGAALDAVMAESEVPASDGISNALWRDPGAMMFSDVLRNAMTAFVVDRDAWKTVIAGYPWFLDWGRDTLICVRGLLEADFKDEVRAVLLQFAKFAENGTLPNIIHGGNVSNRDTSDAALWLFVGLRDYLKKTGDTSILDVPLQGEKKMVQILLETAGCLQRGTPNGIKVNSESNLIFSPPHFTWMDTNYPAGTPRQGYPVEIQSLWFAAQRFLADLTQDPVWHEGALKTQRSVLSYFSLPGGALSDCLNARSPDAPMNEAVATDYIRPNQLFAVTMGVVTDTPTRRAILQACSKLVIPGALRSLADEPVSVPLPVYHNGQLINNPLMPYWGIYEGNEDYRRKPAYHNGTAWTWVYPSYAEAMVMTYGRRAVDTARALLQCATLLTDGCIGQIPEILDGNYPHRQRGCDAQAWGCTELFRVYHALESEGSL